VVIGDLRPYVVALVLPNWPAVRDRLGVEGDGEAMLSDSRVLAAVQAQVDDVNRRLGSWETIKRFALLRHDLQEEEGELTPTLKVRRRAVQNRYAALIDTLYDSPTVRD
jgi:long-chain acyl-CoA synthetase